MLRALTIALVLTLSPAAHAANLPELRTQASGAAARVQGTRTERLALERTLDEVANRIEALKAERNARGGLFANAELDELLKRSQELSRRVTEALRAERDAEQALRDSRSRLVGELDREILRLHGEWDSASGSQRQGLVPRIRALRAERESLRAELPAAQLPRFDRPSDDPEELLERADALLDGADKLRREEQVLVKRIQELTRERELERRMSDFLREGSLFDEHDRRIAISRPGRSAVEAQPNDGSGKTSPPATPSVGTENSSDGTDKTQYDAAPQTPPGGMPVPTEPTTPSRGGGTPVVDDGPRIGVSRMPPERRNELSPYSEDETIEELTARRNRIRGMASDMERQASDAAKRARELR